MIKDDVEMGLKPVSTRPLNLKLTNYLLNQPS